MKEKTANCFHRMKWVPVLALGVLVAGCASEVSYEDPGEADPMSTAFEFSDLNIVASRMVESMLTSPAGRKITADDARPIIVVMPVQNRTDQHIDTEAVTDTVRTRLIQSGEFRLVDKPTRGMQKEEILWQRQGGMVDKEKAVEYGKQFGAQYIMFGSVVSFNAEKGRTTRKTYQFTLNLLDLNTGLIDWADQVPITKEEERSWLGL